MSSRVTISQIVDDITQLSAAVKPAEFLYDFLTCFGLPKATIARLKSGGLNIAKKDGCTLLKTLVDFDLTTEAPLLAIEATKVDRKIAANKPRFSTKRWQEFNPGIFGSMFQGVVDDDNRSMPFTSNEETQVHLFAEYERMTAAEQADLLTPAPAKRAKKRPKS